MSDKQNQRPSKNANAKYKKKNQIRKWDNHLHISGNVYRDGLNTALLGTHRNGENSLTLS